MLVFYERFIEIKPLEDEIEVLEITTKEKEHLYFLVAEILHQHTLEIILTRLPEDDRKTFLQVVSGGQEINLADLLKEKASDYENVLKEKLTKVRDEIIEEVRKVKKLP